MRITKLVGTALCTIALCSAPAKICRADLDRILFIRELRQEKERAEKENTLNLDRATSSATGEEMMKTWSRLKLGHMIISSPPVVSCSVSITGVKTSFRSFDLPRVYKIEESGVTLFLSLDRPESKGDKKDELSVPYQSEFFVGCNCLTKDGVHLIGVRRGEFMNPTEEEMRNGQVRIR
ncbi:MAG: hypothetical protein Q7S22_02085 [Candidatus Micrarchaeota archaeon]|nr:hypothetical protein [Candidatus Micrarchaeota archaeon]